MKSVLDLKIKSYDLDKSVTIREYCKKLLCALIEEGEGFSSKRPFGNSDWDFNLFEPLIKNGYVAGTYDEEIEEIIEIDPNAAAKVITDAIKKEWK